MLHAAFSEDTKNLCKPVKILFEVDTVRCLMHVRTEAETFMGNVSAHITASLWHPPVFPCLCFPLWSMTNFEDVKQNNYVLIMEFSSVLSALCVSLCLSAGGGFKGKWSLLSHHSRSRATYWKPRWDTEAQKGLANLAKTSIIGLGVNGPVLGDCKLDAYGIGSKSVVNENQPVCVCAHTNVSVCVCSDELLDSHNSSSDLADVMEQINNSFPACSRKFPTSPPPPAFSQSLKRNLYPPWATMRNILVSCKCFQFQSLHYVE